MKIKRSNSIKRELDGEHIYNKEFQETEIKSYGDEATRFHDEEMSEVDSN